METLFYCTIKLNLWNYYRVGRRQTKVAILLLIISVQVRKLETMSIHEMSLQLKFPIYVTKGVYAVAM